MSRIISLVAFFACFGTLVLPLNAQEGEVYVSLGGGVSFPLAEYASTTDFYNEGDGFAGTGGNFTINFGYRFNEYLSLSGLLSGSMNRYMNKDVRDWFEEEFAQALPDTRWVVESKSWGIGGFLAGPVASLPLYRSRLFLDGRLMGGFLYAYSPSITIRGTEAGEEDKFILIPQASAPSWVIDAGAGLRYNRTPRQYFTLNADFLYAQAYFSGVGPATENIILDRKDSFTQYISAVNINIGIGYVVNYKR